MGCVRDEGSSRRDRAAVEVGKEWGWGGEGSKKREEVWGGMKLDFEAV